MRIATALFLCFGLPCAHAYAADLKIKAEPISAFKPGSSQTQFGRLEFIGGLVLTSKHEDFGGISGLRFVTDNSFIAITDKARVITGRLERKDGKPHKIKGEKITRIKAPNGRTITGAEDKDAESIELAGNQFLVGYERYDRILRLNLHDRKLVADGSYKVDLGNYDIPHNKGAEAIALDPISGKLFAFTEYALNDAGNHKGFIILGGKVEKEISFIARNGYSLTDAHFLPNGDLLMLERYYNPFTGGYMRLRRVPRSKLDTDKPLDGEILIDVNRNFEIDNMEGLAVSQTQDGSTRITMVSDDNFSKNQRTVLLEFKLLD